MTLQVLVWPNPLLSQVALPVAPEDIPGLHDVVDDMIHIVRTEEAVGLAATQVGLPLRLFVMKSPNGAAPLEHINPRILHADEPQLDREGCLSFPGLSEYMKAPSRVVIESTDLMGRTQEFFFYGLFARCAFHEVQHLDGKTMVDRMGKLQRKLFLKSYARVNRKA